MKIGKISLYDAFATVAVLLALLVVAGSTAFAREAESGGGSSSGSSSGSVSSSAVSSSVSSGGNGGVDSAQDIQERGAGATATAGTGVDLRGDGTVEDNGADDIVNGVKLRGDGTVDDDQPGAAGVSTGVDLRGDGTVEDNGADDIVNGVKLRGDGTVDDNSASSVGASGFDSARDIEERGAFNANLRIGMRHDDVARLQRELEAEGVFSSQATGFFGEITRGAVREFQRRHGLPETGFVGPMTRAELNHRGGSSAALSDDSSGSSSNSGPGSSSNSNSGSGSSSGSNKVSDDNSGSSMVARIGSGMSRFLSDLAKILGM